MGRLDGQVAIVTGAGSGIGRGIAVAFGREGASVVLAARREEPLRETAAEIEAAGGSALVVLTDVTLPEQVERLFARIRETYGRLDLLVNNAGLTWGAPIDEMPIETWNAVIATNLTAAFLCAQQALRIMKPQGRGRIINIGSISAQRVRPNNSAYNASKFGIDGLTHSIALEGRPHGITCGSIHPGNTRAQHNVDTGEPTIGADDLAEAALMMAAAPPHVNVFQAIVLPRDQLYVGRG